MNKNMFLKLCASALAVLSLTAATSAKGFSKTNEYTEGKFTDVPANQWYAAEVKSAYELGFMNGQSDTLFAPDGNVTVAEGITMASRVHAIYNGKTIAEVTGGKWYDMYIAYAKENGLIADGQFENFDRNIMRYEMAVMFANAMPKDYFAAKNDIKDIPDVAETEEYYDELMMLYKAGVVLGSDDYGNFYATNPIKRSETAAIINRVALPENRKEGKLLEYGDRNPAVYLIRDDRMTRGVRELTYIASGWTYYDPAISQKHNFDYSFNKLVDVSDKTYACISKEVKTVTSGKLTFEGLFNASANGARIIFENLDGNTLLEVKNDGGKLVVVGAKENATDVVFGIGAFAVYVNFDMDSNKAEVILGDKSVGVFDMSDAGDLSRVRIATGVKESLNLTTNNIYLYWNFDVNDSFRFASKGTKPYGWTVSENVVIDEMTSDVDTMSVKVSGEGTASKKFDKVSDKFVFETYVLVPEGQDASVLMMNGGKTALSVDANGGEFSWGRTEAALSTSADKLLRKYTPGVWQLIRVEVDTAAKTALIKINGKETKTLPYNEDGFDGIEIIARGNGDFWFDDVAVYNTYDYADYCPEPVPVNDDEWYAGMSICSLWQEGSHAGWDHISPYEEITPVLGYYDEGIPEVADWEIKFMVEHGYDYQRFCWYHGGRYGAMKRPRLVDNALHDGFFNAKYSDMMDFEIMWENSTSEVTKEQFKNEVWPYWVDWYLTDDRYFCIDNKPVITIFYYDTFRSKMGGKDAVKEVIDFMDAECKKLGYDGAIIYVSNSAADAALNEEFAYVGIQAKAAYHFEEPSYDIEYQKIRMNAELEAGSVTFIPSCGIGFNDIGWTETRTPLASAEDFEKILRWSRDEYLPNFAKYGENDWHTKSVLTTTWNEFGEGHYVFPSGLNKFGYMDAHRRVFSSVADTPDSKHFDVEPTDNQKTRLGYLYQTRRIPMRALLLEDAAKTEYELVHGWDFEKPEDCAKWGPLAKTTVPVFDPVEKALVGTMTAPDGHIKMLSFDENFFNADGITVLHINMKIEKSGASTGNFYFNSEKKDNYVASKGANFTVIADGEYHDYYIDLTKIGTWKGEIKALRFDPIDTVNTYYIKKFEFLKKNDSKNLNFSIDTAAYKATENTFEIDGNNIYLAANPSQGFYAMNQFYYEWNRWNGTLLLKTGNGHEFKFVVGSDKAVVDGAEKTLDKAVELYDGLVVLPLTYIYDVADYDYKIDGNTVKVEIRMKGYEEALASRKINEFEFNLNGDTENWSVSGGSGVVENGCIKIQAIHNGTRFDPQMQNSKFNADTLMYDKIEVRVRPTFTGTDTSGRDMTIYFSTDINTKLREAQTVHRSYKDYTPDAEGFYTVTFDMKENEFWVGNAKTIRFDPANCDGYFEIDYLKLIANPDSLAKLEQAQKDAEEYEKNLRKADDGEPFYIRNADAEGAYGPEYSSGSTLVSIVDDDLRPGNKAFLVTTTAKGKSWCYFIVPTRFKPGTTYKVDFEYRLIGDVSGGEANNIPFSVNFRYADFNADGGIVDRKDHAKGPSPQSKASTKDGWIKCSITHTVAANSPSRSNDYFCIFTDPVERDGNIYNHQYMLDNFVVTVVE